MKGTEIGGAIAGGLAGAAAGEVFVNSTFGVPVLGGLVGFMAGAAGGAHFGGTEIGEKVVGTALPHTIQALGMGILTGGVASMFTSNLGVLGAAAAGGVALYGGILYSMDRAGML
jgi:hypothetical protein